MNFVGCLLTKRQDRGTSAAIAASLQAPHEAAFARWTHVIQPVSAWMTKHDSKRAEHHTFPRIGMKRPNLCQSLVRFITRACAQPFLFTATMRLLFLAVDLPVSQPPPRRRQRGRETILVERYGFSR